MADNMRMPVTILTGFLGAGKTTLLNQWLSQSSAKETLIIVNEFGEIGLDHQLVTHQLEQTMVVELSNGCLCCQLRTDLKKTLKDIHWRFSRNGVRQFKRVVIETSGLADPVPILHTVMTDPYVAASYQLDGVVTVIDAILGDVTLQQHPEAMQQVRLADRLLISKTELAEHQRLTNLEQLLHVLNPVAPVLRLEPTLLASQGVGLLSGLAAADGFPHWLPLLAEPLRHGAEVSSFSLTLRQPIPPQDFERWLARLRDDDNPDLLRFKGIFYLEGEPVPLAVHRVQHVLHIPEPLLSWRGEEEHSHLVFITRLTAGGALRHLLQSLAKFVA